jgi:hypothetical protein
MSSANVTLTAAQYGKPIISLSGVLTANLNLIFPNIVGQWLIVNNCTGAYTVTCKTSAGTGVATSISSVQTIYGDGTNIGSTEKNPTWSVLGFAILLATNGYIKFPTWLSGFTLQWGNVSTSEGTFSFPIAFSTACLGFVAMPTSMGSYVDAAAGHVVSSSQFYVTTKNSNDGSLSNYACNWIAVGY